MDKTTMQAGQMIAGKYRLNRLLGSGGMASVWSATNIFIDREFAIKFMLPQVARTAEAARRFLLEAKVSARINHPNIIDVIDVGQAEDGALFLVMELLTGMSLDVAVRRQTPPMMIAEFLLIMRDVARALAAAHRSGVVHRDLKPTNVFVHQDRHGRILTKVLDFGVSKILEEGNNMSFTVVGTVLGSPLYMSPEQAMGSAGIDGRTDVFAFGGILFEALTGQRAYDAPNFNALIVTIATKQPNRIDDVAPNLPEPLRALVRNCLVTEKNDRLASFDHIVERLTTMMPEVERYGLRLPAPSTARVAPVSSMPAAPERSIASVHEVVPPAGASAFVSTKPPDVTPHAFYGARVLVRVPPRTLALAVGFVALVALLAALRTTRRASLSLPSQNLKASSVSGPTETKVPSPASQAAASSDVPVISVDSLPVASSRTSHKGAGKLSIAANPGWCAITVDGSPRGVTPLALFELSAGPHRIDCAPPTGKARSATVVVIDSSAGHYKFSLDD